MSTRKYRELIWTDHALERLSERKLTQELVYQAFNAPDKTNPSYNGKTEFVKRIHHSTITLIANPNERGEWVVISCWIDPPLPGTRDAKKKDAWKKYQKAGFWGKLWYTVKQQLGWY